MLCKIHLVLTPRGLPVLLVHKESKVHLVYLGLKDNKVVMESLVIREIKEIMVLKDNKELKE